MPMIALALLLARAGQPYHNAHQSPHSQTPTDSTGATFNSGPRHIAAAHTHIRRRAASQQRPNTKRYPDAAATRNARAAPASPSVRHSRARR
jgi:hypothetical protein